MKKIVTLIKSGKMSAMWNHGQPISSIQIGLVCQGDVCDYFKLSLVIKLLHPDSNKITTEGVSF